MGALSDVRIFERDEVARAAPYADLVESLRLGHLDAPAQCERIVYGPGDGQNFMALPAWQPGDAIGIKLVTIFPDNPARHGVPSVQAVVLLFDGEQGGLLAMIDGTELTYRKTAADSALGSSLLSRPDSHTLLMVGAGGLAPHMIAAHRAVRPSIRRVLVWNRSRDTAAALVDRGLADEVVDDLEAATGDADVVSTATMSKEPLIRGAWLRPGTHLDCVGAYLPDHREIDTEAVRRSELFVDSRQAAIDEGGDLVVPMQRGDIDVSHVRADLFQLCRGDHPGRSEPEAITLFENGGGGHLDLMTARHIWASR